MTREDLITFAFAETIRAWAHANAGDYIGAEILNEYATLALNLADEMNEATS